MESVFGWTGRYHDSDTGLQWNGSSAGGGRWYDPKMGRWISEDRIEFGRDVSNVGRYVGNDPTNKMDPSGLQAGPCSDQGSSKIQIDKITIDSIEADFRNMLKNTFPGPLTNGSLSLGAVNQAVFKTLLKGILLKLSFGSVGKVLTGQFQSMKGAEEITMQSVTAVANVSVDVTVTKCVADRGGGIFGIGEHDLGTSHSEIEKKTIKLQIPLGTVNLTTISGANGVGVMVNDQQGLNLGLQRLKDQIELNLTKLPDLIASELKKGDKNCTVTPLPKK